MPAEWRFEGPSPEGGGPSAILRLRPHRPLGPRGFAVFIGATFVLALVPLGAVLGTAVLWVLLAFLMAALAMVWIALRASSAEAALTETLTLEPGRVALERREPGGSVRRWEANPHWVQVVLHPEGERVENYVTLRGGGREVEIGAFLSPSERVVLRDELEVQLRRFS